MVHFVCLLYFIYLLEGEGGHALISGAGGGVGTCTLYFVAAVALCVHVRGTGANLNTVKRIVTLHWKQTNLIYIYKTIHLKKVSIQMNLKIPCTSCSD